MIGSALARRSAGRRASEVLLVGIKYLRASQDASGRSISVASQRDEGTEFGADIPGEWELDHDPERRVILCVRSRRITRKIAALIRHFGTTPDTLVTLAPPPFAIPAPREHDACSASAPVGKGKTTLISTVLRRYLEESFGEGVIVVSDRQPFE